MLSNQHQKKSTFLNRWVALPLITLLFTAFTIKSGIPAFPVKTAITVVIDAGHGGERSGAMATDGTLEKDLNLAIAKKIVELNTNKDIKLILTRESDVQVPLKDIVAKAVSQQADAFISIHVSAGQSPSGFELVVSARNQHYAKESQLLGTIVSKELGNIYKVAPQLKKGNDDKGIWVLDAPEINYPSLLIECGNLTQDEDLAFLKNPANQEKIAGRILKAIATFANSSLNK
jgi:N-acetylmuramoyl-L-alanine amidase